jgi:MFS family permease
VSTDPTATTHAAAQHPLRGGHREDLQRRTLRVLLLSQVFAGAGLAAGVSVGALLAQQMLDSTSSSGLPSALFTFGSAITALLVGRLSQTSGRRPGLAAGFLVGALGAVAVVIAAALDSVPLLFIALLFYGAGTATNLQARYAGGDLAEPARRGRAMSTVLVATTLGAVAGPNLVDPTGALATSLGVPKLAGPFMLAAVAYTLAGLVVLTLLRPDPLLLARADAAPPTATGPAPAAPIPRTVLLAGAAMVLTQLVMVAIMTMTPIHMHEHGHGLGASGLVISIHIAAMYLPSPLSGYLADRFGRLPLLGAAAVTLLAAGFTAAVVPAGSTLLLAFALALLGLGWSFGIVAGTALITDAAPLDQRARIQGGADLCVALAGATGGLGSGYVVAMSSYQTLSLIGGLLGLALLPLLVAEARADAEAW